MDALVLRKGKDEQVVAGPGGVKQDDGDTDGSHLTHGGALGLQINVGQGHLGDFVEADGERDGTQHEQRVVDSHSHGDDHLPLPGSCLHQHSAGQIHQEEDKADDE